MTKPSKPEFKPYTIACAAASIDTITISDGPYAYFPSNDLVREENLEPYDTLHEALVLRTKDDAGYNTVVLTPKKVEELVTVLQYWLVTHGGV